MKTETSHVALWLGRARTKRAFDRALAIKYSAAGDSLGSEFGRAFGLRYDDDHREAMKLNKRTQSLHELLGGISYEAQALPALVRAGAALSPGDNCFICLYDFRPPTRIRASWTTPTLNSGSLWSRNFGDLRPTSVGGCERSSRYRDRYWPLDESRCGCCTKWRSLGVGAHACVRSSYLCSIRNRLASSLSSTG